MVSDIYANLFPLEAFINRKSVGTIEYYYHGALLFPRVSGLPNTSNKQ